MENDLGKHKRWSRKARHLMKILSKTRVKSVRLAIMEELQHEITRAKESRAGKAVKRGAIGAAGWGKRVIAKGEDYAKGPARRNHTRASVGAYARQQAIEREKNRPARDAAKLARRQQKDAARLARTSQRATRKAQRAKQGPGIAARVKAARASRNGQTAKTPAARTKAPATPRAPRQPVTGPRPSVAARATRSAQAPAAKSGRPAPLPAETVRPARKPRTKAS